MFRIIFEKTIPHTQVLATTETHDSGGFPGFLIPKFRCSTGTEFTPRQIHYTHLTAGTDELQDGAGTGQFHIVRMSAKGKHI